MHTVVLVLVEVLIAIELSRLLGLGCGCIKQPLMIGESVPVLISNCPSYALLKAWHYLLKVVQSLEREVKRKLIQFKYLHQLLILMQD